MRIIKAFVLGITWFNKWLGKYLKFIPLFLLALLLIGVFFRYVLNAPIAWEMEILAYAFNGYFLLVGGYVLIIGGFIKMDVFYCKWNQKTRAIINACTFLLVVVYLVPLILKGLYYAYISFTIDERWISAAATPLYPFKFVFVIGCTLLLLQAIAFFINDFHIIITGSSIINAKEENREGD